MRYFKWDTKSRRLAALRDLQYYSKMGRTANLSKVIISRRGEPYENPDLALWDLQYYSKLGRTANLPKLQSREEENHMKIRISHYRTCRIIQKQDGPNTYPSLTLGKGHHGISRAKMDQQGTEDEKTLLSPITPVGKKI